MTIDRTAQQLAPLAQPGELISGKYRVERVIAIGGMGVVLAARNEDLDQQVALKILRQDAMTNEEAVLRFLREARTAARLQGEHVARVFDVGTTESGVPYMVMEFLSGLDLQQLIDTRGPLPIQDAVDYVLQALEAVAEAHAAGVVHRDIKPSNLFLADRSNGIRRIKVLDFGISKGQGLDAPAAPGITATKQVMGSPGYMSPEQMISPRTVDGRADIWSFGVLLYALLTGEQPFQGETVAAVMASILHQSVPRLRDKRADAPAALERVVERCLQREMKERYANVGKLAHALEPLGSSFAKLSTSRIQSAIVTASPAGQTLLNARRSEDADSLTDASWARTTFSVGSRRKLLGLGLAMMLLGAAGGALWLAWTPQHPSTELLHDRRDEPGQYLEAPATIAPAAAEPVPAKVLPGPSSPTTATGVIIPGKVAAAPRFSGAATAPPSAAAGVPSQPGAVPKLLPKATSEADMLKDRH